MIARPPLPVNKSDWPASDVMGRRFVERKKIIFQEFVAGHRQPSTVVSSPIDALIEPVGFMKTLHPTVRLVRSGREPQIQLLYPIRETNIAPNKGLIRPPGASLLRGVASLYGTTTSTVLALYFVGAQLERSS